MKNNLLYDPQIFKMTQFRIVDLTSANIEVVKKALVVSEIDGVHISHYRGFSGDSIEILRGLPNLGALMIHEPERFDCSVLEVLYELKFLQIGGRRKKPINFAKFPNLIDLQITWHDKDVMPKEFSQLESLYIWYYKSASQNLAALPLAKSLNSLGFAHGNLETLEGIDRYPRLKDIDLAYCAKLQSIAALQETNVERIHLESCKKIDDMTSLADCPKLKSIRMSKGAALKSLAFLNESRTLEEFRFVTTDVIDGDLTPLLRMKHVGFLPKRNFSHTPEQIKALIGDTSP